MTISCVSKSENRIEFELDLRIGSSRQGYVGIGFGEGVNMIHHDIVKAEYNRDKGIVQIRDFYSQGWLPVLDNSLGGVDDVFEKSHSFIGDRIIARFSKQINPSEPWDYTFPKGDSHFIFSVNFAGWGKHNSDNAGMKIQF